MKGPAITPAQRQRTLERDGFACVRCGAGPFGLSIHHRQPRGMGGSTLAAQHAGTNLLSLCGDGVCGCHGWVESNRTQGYAEGWLVPRWAEPYEWAVRLPSGAWAAPRDSFWIPVAPTEAQEGLWAALEDTACPASG